MISVSFRFQVLVVLGQLLQTALKPDRRWHELESNTSLVREAVVEPVGLTLALVDLFHIGWFPILLHLACIDREHHIVGGLSGLDDPGCDAVDFVFEHFSLFESVVFLFVAVETFPLLI